MQERFLKRNQVVELDIIDLAFGGVGIAKIPTDQGEFTVFVQNTVPGQRVRARVEKAQKRFAECRLMDILQPSPEEVEIPYQRIPGAPYAAWPIEQQRAYKQRNTLDLFRRIGKVDDVENLLDAYIESPAIWHYRNKMEYAFSVIRYDLNLSEERDDFGLGFKHRGTWWCVENLDRDSGLFDASFESMLHRIREKLQSTGMPAWLPPKQHGFFRYLVVRKSILEDRLLVNLVTSAEAVEQFDVHGFAQWLKSELGDRLAGLIHTINPNTGDRIDPLNGSSEVVLGDSVIVEEILGLRFEVSMTSFFQTNPKSAERLYERVLSYAGVHDADDGQVILDLFCGTGTITQLLAKQSKRAVVGVDIVADAIEDARRNAQRNGVDGVTFHAADVGKFLVEHPIYQGRIQCIVLDPPRSGIAPKTLRKVIALDAPRLVYVSCNPATQARDTIELMQAGYRMKRLTLVDQFPHTSHIETVACFEKEVP
jgi:23S rRNA (uracil-5-)-methyltransferase RumA